jgi:hypothetical protein
VIQPVIAVCDVEKPINPILHGVLFLKPRKGRTEKREGREWEDRRAFILRQPCTSLTTSRPRKTYIVVVEPFVKVLGVRIWSVSILEPLIHLVLNQT